MQSTATPEPPVWGKLGAIAQAQGRFTRRIPSARAQGHGSIFVSLARFESDEAAESALQTMEDEGLSSVREYWPTMDVMDVDVSLGQGAAYRRLLSGTISRDGESLFSDFLEIRVDDIVAQITGYSSYVAITLETAYIGYLVYSLMDADDESDLAQFLPSDDMLIGGIEVAD